MTIADAQDVTAVQLAAQFGFGTSHGAIAWRVVLSSPLESERCRMLLEKVAQAEDFEYPKRSADPTAPFTMAPRAELVLTTASATVVQFFEVHGSALTAACISQLGEPGKQPWARNARPLLTLMREASGVPTFAQFIREDPTGRKVYPAYLRAILRLVKDGAWAGSVGLPEDEVPYEHQYANYGAPAMAGYNREGDVLTALLVTLPVLLRVIAALEAAPGGNALPVQNARAVEHTRAQLAANQAALVEIARARPALVWDDDRATGTGARLAYVYAGLEKVSNSFRV